MTTPYNPHVEWEWQRYAAGFWYAITTHQDYTEAINQPFDIVPGRLRLVRRTTKEEVLP